MHLLPLCSSLFPLPPSLPHPQGRKRTAQSFSVTVYFAKQFDALRHKCCSSSPQPFFPHSLSLSSTHGDATTTSTTTSESHAPANTFDTHAGTATDSTNSTEALPVISGQVGEASGPASTGGATALQLAAEGAAGLRRLGGAAAGMDAREQAAQGADGGVMGAGKLRSQLAHILGCKLHVGVAQSEREGTAAGGASGSGKEDVEFVRSLCRCKRWSAEGGKSAVYFAKTADDRFVIKQVDKRLCEAACLQQ